MEEKMKHLCAPIPAPLHAWVCEGQESSDKTLGQYMTWLLTKFYENERGVNTSMTEKRTVAFQVPAELSGQFKAYLEKHSIK